jgi:hypothetical protein
MPYTLASGTSKFMKLQFEVAQSAILFCALLGMASAQQLQRLQEENLAGQQIVLPDAAAGKVAVLVFGFSRASQYSTDAWMRHLRKEFGKNSGVLLYQLPVLEDAPRLIRGMITSGMKRGVPEGERSTFVPVMHNEADLKRLVGYKEADDAYLVVLDRTGKVAYQAHGGTDVRGYAVLQAKLQGLLK